MDGSHPTSHRHQPESPGRTMKHRLSTALWAWGRLLGLLAMALATNAGAQDTGGASARAPRFYRAAEKGAAVPIDASRTPALSRRISLDLEDVPLKQALAILGQQAHLNIVYSDDVLPGNARV